MIYHVNLQTAIEQFWEMCESLDLSPNLGSLGGINAIRSAAIRLSNLSEKECSGVSDPKNPRFMKWDERDQELNDKARAVAERKASAALDSMFGSADRSKIEIEFQGDPRGPSIIIQEVGGLRRLVALW